VVDGFEEGGVVTPLSSGGQGQLKKGGDAVGGFAAVEGVHEALCEGRGGERGRRSDLGVQRDPAAAIGGSLESPLDGRGCRIGAGQQSKCGELLGFWKSD
jgi:hypothetical protein